MKAARVKISDLKDCTDCLQATESIQLDHRNTLGGWAAFNSGDQTYLTAEACRKVEAIGRKFDRLSEQQQDDPT